MVLQAENLDELLESARETWNHPLVQTFLTEHRYIEVLEEVMPRMSTVWPDDLIRELDHCLRSYIQSWTTASDAHTQSLLYQKILEVAGITDEFVLDIGCGTGGLLAELPTPGIGVDINYYALQTAQQRLEARGRKVERYSRAQISFHPEQGFVLRPNPYLIEPDPQSTVLLIDDIRTLQNAKRLVYNTGRQADVLTFTLWGGYSGYQGIEFIQKMAEAAEARKPVHEENPFWLHEAILREAPKLCKKGGRVIFADRRSNITAKEIPIVYDSQGRTVDIAQLIHDQQKTYAAFCNAHGFVITEKGAIPLTTDETAAGLSISVQLPGYTAEESQRLLKAAGLKVPIEVYVTELKVK